MTLFGIMHAQPFEDSPSPADATVEETTTDFWRAHLLGDARARASRDPGREAGVRNGRGGVGVAGGIAITSAWASRTTVDRMWRRRVVRDLGTGPLEHIFNTPSHHRVHHGSNRQYLDRNHGSILIPWDRLFGTFEREDEPVVYVLTKNVDTFNPARVARARRHAARRRAVAHLARAALVRVAGPGLGVPPRRRARGWRGRTDRRRAGLGGRRVAWARFSRTAAEPRGRQGDGEHERRAFAAGRARVPPLHL